MARTIVFVKVADFLGKTALQKLMHSHSSIEFTTWHASTERMANVQKYNPAHELAATNACAGMLSRYRIDCHYPANHPKRLTGTIAAI